jgi:hypothetical protein
MPTDDLAAELASSGAPAWLAPLLVELRGLRGDVGELTKTVRGGGSEPGHAEQLRALGGRVTFLESLVKWLAGIGTAVLTAIVIGWATLTGGHTPPPTHP